MKYSSAVFAALLLLSVNATAGRVNNLTCEIRPPAPLTNPYGPYDYTNPAHNNKLPIVVNAHFDQDIQRLIAGKDHSGDLLYTLRAIPNYHPALYAASQYSALKRLNLQRSFTADCFFRRAIYFQPRDATSQMLFAMHLQSTNRFKLAQQYYESALKIAPQAAELNYNYGLFMLQRGHVKRAKEAATIAYKRGYPLQGLKQKLASKKAIEVNK